MNKTIELQVIHETAYGYAARVELAHHLGYLQPLEDRYQSLRKFNLEIWPQPARVKSDFDSYHNSRFFFSLYAPHDRLRVRAESRVRLCERFIGLDTEAGAPWEQVRDATRYVAGRPFVPESEFAFASPFVPLHTELRDYAMVSFTPGRPISAAAVDLMHRIHADFKYESQSTQISTPVLAAFQDRRGVCQDFAHIMIGCMRALGLAVRYVSGYLMTVPPPGQESLVGADASHAWVSVYCPGIEANGGWLDLDPTNDLIPGLAHVTLAIGRDFGDVSPLRGVIRGGGSHTLSVGVSVKRMAPSRSRTQSQNQDQAFDPVQSQSQAEQNNSDH
jgi:transglutaminase-like putative cysteine protease